MTSYFTIQGIQKEKERRQLRGSGEIGKKKKVEENEETGGSYART